MSYSLPKLTDADFEVDYSRKRKYSTSSSSTESSGNSSPSSSSTSEANISSNSGQSKKPHPVQTSIDDSLSRKRTLPATFCPKQRTATNRFQPSNVKVSEAPRIPYIAKPLRHIPRRPLVDSNKNMMAYREYRELERQKAQEAKLNGAPEEPPKKKRAPRRKFNN